MKNLLIYIAITVCLLSCVENKKYNNEIESDYERTYKNRKEKEPEWIPFETFSRDKKGDIYSEIKVDKDYFVVWVRYKWRDTTNLQYEDRNIEWDVICYAYDENFIKLGGIARYQYSKNGDAITEEVHTQPQWSFIIPGSEGENIAKSVISILEARFPYNKKANRLHSNVNN